MDNIILAIGYSHNEQDKVRAEWKNHNFLVHFIDDVSNAMETLRRTSYIGISICSKELADTSLELLRSVQPAPIILLTNSYDPNRVECVQCSVAQYMKTAGKDMSLGQGNDLSRYLLMSRREPLTILSAKDVRLCLEYRSVEIRNQTIKFTAKEFDIIALLMSHPRLTHEPSFQAKTTRKSPKSHVSQHRRQILRIPTGAKAFAGAGVFLESFIGSNDV